MLVELFTEEVPARFQKTAEQSFSKLITDGLKGAGLDFVNVQSFVTPRRMSVIVEGLPEKQPDVSEERKGPKVGSPEQAVNGFLKSIGASLDDCQERDGVYYFVINKKGQATGDVLADIILNAIGKVSWANSMRFAENTFRWVRPLRRIIATFGEDVIKGTLDLGGGTIAFTNVTAGHRFMAPSDVVVNADTYKVIMANSKVILNRDERRDIVLTDLEKQAKDLGITLIYDEGLLQEVIGLIEHPTVLIGKIEDRFMALPAEVLTTSMREHQKFFAFNNSNDTLAPYFATVSNVQAKDGGKAIITGNETVLRARLADSEFFYNNDLKIDLENNLENNLEKLKNVVFHAKLGTVYERVERMTLVAVDVANTIGADAELTKQATRLAKADLVSEMVFEFPELQGIMGKYYAVAQGKNMVVANAIEQHYKPVGANDTCPTNTVAIAVSVAEKIDTLTGFWLIDEKPTGSKDPYALRRSALGIIRMILENELRIDLGSVITTSAKTHAVSGDITNDLLGFFTDRVKAHLKSAGIRHDFIGAVLAGGIVDLVAQVRLATELSNNAEVVGQVKASYVRAKNITDKAEDFVISSVSESVLEQAEEKELFKALSVAKATISNAVKAEDFSMAVSTLASIAPVIDAFFEAVMVNADDVSVRSNRLNLLGEIMATANTIADFNTIES